MEAFRNAFHGTDDGIELSGPQLHGPVVRDFAHLYGNARSDRRDPGNCGRKEEYAVIDPADMEVPHEGLRVKGILFQEMLIVVKDSAHLRHEFRRAPGGGKAYGAAREELVLEGFPELREKSRGSCGRYPELIGRIHQILRLIEGLEENESVAVQCFFHISKIEYSKSDRSP